MRKRPHYQRIQQFPTSIPNLDYTLQIIMQAGQLFESVERRYGNLVIRLNPQFINYTEEEKNQLLTHFLDLIKAMTTVHCYIIGDTIETNVYRLNYGNT